MRNGRSTGAGSLRNSSSASSTVGPSYQGSSAERSAMLSPPRAETGMKRGRLDADLVEERAVLPHDPVEDRAVPAHQVHLVDHHGELPDAEQRHHVAVAPGVLLHALRGVDHQQRRFGARGAGDHVLEELDVAGRVEDEVVAQVALEEDPGRVDGDALGLLVLERVEQEGVLERLRVQLALRSGPARACPRAANGCRPAAGR